MPTLSWPAARSGAQAAAIAPVVKSLRVSMARLVRGPRRDVGVDQPQRPLNCLDEHLLQLGLVPVRVDVPESGVKDAALAIHLRPRDGEVVVLAMHARV